MAGFDYAYTVEVLSLTFSPMDLLFYGLAVWQGWKFAFRSVSQERIQQALTAR